MRLNVEFRNKPEAAFEAESLTEIANWAAVISEISELPITVVDIARKEISRNVNPYSKEVVNEEEFKQMCDTGDLIFFTSNRLQSKV